MKSTVLKTLYITDFQEMRLFKPNFFIFCLLLLSFTLIGQNKVSSIAFTDSILKYSNNNSEKLIFFSKKLQRSDDFCDILSGISSEAKGHYQNKDYFESEKLINRILNTDGKNLNKEQIICLKRKKINAFNRLFWIRNNQENYNEAYKHIISAELINESFTHKSDFYYRYKLNIETSKALIKAKLNLFDEAKNILINAYNEVDKIPFTDSISLNSVLLQKANITNSIADNYLNLSKEKSNKSFIDSADVYYKKAYEISKDFKPKH